jgi:hypothetical protein
VRPEIDPGKFVLRARSRSNTHLCCIPNLCLVRDRPNSFGLIRHSGRLPVSRLRAIHPKINRYRLKAAPRRRLKELGPTPALLPLSPLESSGTIGPPFHTAAVERAYRFLTGPFLTLLGIFPLRRLWSSRLQSVLPLFHLYKVTYAYYTFSRSMIFCNPLTESPKE